MKQYVLDNIEALKENLKRSEPRECTPYTHPQCFDLFQNENVRTKAHIKIANDPQDTHQAPCPLGSIWCEDWLHCDQFEVYQHDRALKNNTKLREVWIDGRTKKL